LNPDNAYNEVSKIIREVLKIKPDWIYKKVDSVLRGHILIELKAIQKKLKKNKVLLVPSNPEYGRKIIRNIYYVNNIPLHLTSFSKDPEFPISSSDIFEILGASEDIPVSLISKCEDIKEGINIAEDSVKEDLSYWAKKLNEDIIPAGASGFFSAILKEKGFIENINNENTTIQFGKNFLIICGSSFSQGKIDNTEAWKKGAKVCVMPDEIFYNTHSKGQCFKKWLQEIINSYNIFSKVIIEINQPVIKNPGFAKRLRNDVARAVNEIMKNVEINELFIEGGATVYAIAKKLKLDQFLPSEELAPGVLRMKIENKPNFYLTIKPGSYLWPKIIWNY